MSGLGLGTVQAARRRRGVSQPPALAALPRQSNIIARWSADTIPAQADTSELSSWTDAVGGMTMAGSGATRPKYRTALEGGKPGVEFTAASGHKLVLPRAGAAALNAATTSRRYTVFIVHRQTGAAGGAAMLFSTGNGSVPLAFFSDGSSIGRNGENMHRVAYSAQTLTTLGFTASNDPYLSRTFVNGGCAGSIIALGPDGGTADYAMGNDADGSYANNCILFDVVWWDRDLTPVELLQCEKWARDKYGQAYPWASAETFDVYHGDSLTQGAGATTADVAYPNIAAAALRQGFGTWTNIGIGGATIAQLDARAVYEVDGIATVTGKPVRLVFGEFYNSAIEGGGVTNSAAQCAAQVGTYLANRRAAGIDRIALWTCVDSGGGGNQDIVRAKKAAFVSELLGLSPTLYDVLIRTDQNATIGVDGAWANATYFTGDGIHLYGQPATPNGYSVLAGLVAPALATLNRPLAPAIALTPGNAQISTAWTDATVSAPTVTQHQLYGGASPDVMTAAGAPFAAASPRAYTGLANGVPWYVALSAISAKGEGPRSAAKAVTPSANPLFYFGPDAFPSGATHSRASTARRTNAAGLLVSEAVDAVCYDYHPVTLAYRGILVEPAATNLIFPSEAFNSIWSAENSATVFANGVLAPDGTTTADAVTLPAVSGAGIFRCVSRQVSAGSGNQAVSVWLKGAVGGERVQLLSTPDGTSYLRTSPDPIVLTTSWRRYSFGTTGGAANPYIIIGVDNRSGTLTTAGQTFHVWGAQVEAAAAPTGYVPTSGGTAARAATVLTLDWASRGVANGTHMMRYTSGDGQTLDVETTVAGGTAAVPTGLGFPLVMVERL